ncbi:MAG: hypothetical protein H0U53_01835 [Actinobacteria bacterium]|nr:hypothetical protein [Actinomycetota bacterium]
MRPFRHSTAMILLVASLVSCTQKSAVSYKTVGDLGEALNAEERICAPLEVGSGEADLVQEQGTCPTDDGDVEVFLFDGIKKRDQWLALGARLREATAVGPNWAVIGEEEAVRKVADALGAEMRD